MKNQRIKKLTVAGMLTAIGILIPMFMPIRLVLEPMSFTLGSHIVIFMAMFISPLMAAAVAVGTSVGFWLGGFPPVVVLRAASHIVFALIGAWYLHNIAKESLTFVKARIFSFLIAIIHGISEVVVVSIFFFGGNVHPRSLEQGFFMGVLVLVGVGTMVHSMVDFELARLIVRPLKLQQNLANLFRRG